VRSRARSRIGWITTLALAVIVSTVLVACSSGSDFDREAAIDTVLAEGQGTISRAQAECYVDEVREKIGIEPLAPGYTAPPAVVPRLTGIRIDCIGVANLGTTPPATVDPDLSVRDALAQRRGDDPVLDALYDACGAGDGVACDRLFEQAPVGSEYETFASTCGNRRAELSCAGAYPTPPGMTTPTVAPSSETPTSTSPAPVSTSPDGPT